MLLALGVSGMMPAAEADVLPVDGAFEPRIPGLTRVNSMLATDTRVFVTSPDTGLIVLRHDGSVVTTFQDMAGSAGMVILGQTLYVAVPDASRVDVFDISQSPPVRTGNLSTAPFTIPADLAYAGGKLWFTAGGCWDSSGTVVSMNLDGSSLVEFVPPESVDWSYCPSLTASEFAPSRLFIRASQGAPLVLYEYDVAEAPYLVTSSDFGSGNFHGSDIGVLPGGSEFVMGNLANSPVLGLGQFATADFAGPSISYVAEDMAGAMVEVTSGNGGLIAGGIGRAYVDQVWVWRVGDPQPLVSFDFGYADVVVGELAFTPDGDRLFALVDRNDGGIDLVSLDPTGGSAALRLRASKGTVNFGTAVRLTATLGGGDTNRTVHIYRLDGDRRKLIAEEEVDRDGKLSVNDRPDFNTDYVAEYEGDGSTPPATSNEVTVKVRPRVVGRMLRADGRSGRYHLYDYTDHCPSDPRTCPLFGVTVDPPHYRATIAYELQVFEGGRWQSAITGEAPLGGDSAVIIYFSANSVQAIGVPARVRAQLPAHQDHAEGSSSWSYFRWR